jgi:putative ABC transport system substrate-binding protein
MHLLMSPACFAQSQTYRIAFVRADKPPAEYITAFRQGLGDMGYHEGKNAVIEARWADGSEANLRSLVADIVSRKFDVIVTSSPAATRATMEATTTIPIVMVLVADPVNFKFVASLSRPGGNVTGFAYLLPELCGKRLQLLKEAVPSLSRVAVMWNGKNPYKPVDLKEVQAVAAALNIELLEFPIQDPSELPGAFELAVKKRVQGLITLDDPFTVAQRNTIVELARKHKLPTVYGLQPYIDAGGLMSYGPDPLDQLRRASIVVDRILKGAKPADLPVERPTKFDFIINQKEARTIGFQVPVSIKLRATRVME